MICTSFSDVIGFTCHPLSEDGNVAMVETPFSFPDGDAIPIFIERISNQIRFFDDGGLILHLLGRGISLDDHRKTRFIKNLAEPHGVKLNDLGELEIWSDKHTAPTAFANYLSTMLALSSWEAGQEGVSTDTSFFLDEVAFYLRAWKANAELTDGFEYKGVSGQLYKLDFQFDGKAVLAIGSHPTSINAAARKLLDIRASSDNNGLKILIIMDDRADAESAAREGLVFDSLGNVMMMSRLAENAKTPYQPKH